MMVFFDDLVAVEGFDVLLGEHLKEVFVAGATRWVAGAGLLGAENGKVDARFLQELRYGACDLLGAVVVAGGAADPVEDLGVGLVAQERDVEAVGPVGPVHRGDVPRVAVGLDAIERALKLAGEFVLHHDFLASHADDLVDVRNHDGTLLFACATGRAAPNHIRVEDVRNQIDDCLTHEVAACRRRWEGVNRLLVRRSAWDPPQAHRPVPRPESPC